MADVRAEHEARWRARYEANAAVLAGWAAEASAGVFTIEVEPHDSPRRRYVSLRRADGLPLGYHDSFGQHEPITGIQLDIYVSDVTKLDRRHRRDMLAVYEAVRRAFYSRQTWADTNFAYLRAEIADGTVGEGSGRDERMNPILDAMHRFQTRNRLDQVKAR